MSIGYLFTRILLTLLTAVSLLVSAPVQEARSAWVGAPAIDAVEDEALRETAEKIALRLRELGWADAEAVASDGAVRVRVPGATDAEVVETALCGASFCFKGPDGKIILTGKNLVEAGALFIDPDNSTYGVYGRLDEAGTQAFAEATARWIGQPIAIVIDGEVVTMPTVSQPITGGIFYIAVPGSGTEDSFDRARELASILMRGDGIDWTRAEWTVTADGLEGTLPAADNREDGYR